MKPNKERQAGTEADSDMQPIEQCQADILPNPLLAAALTKLRKRDLLDKSQTFERLSWSQLRSLIWWEWFNKKKLSKFFEMLQKGKAARFAFEDAKRCS
jgi:hypothetical protein